MNADGSFVVSWTNDNVESGSADIYARQFNGDGSAKGSELLVNSRARDDQNELDGAGLAEVLRRDFLCLGEDGGILAVVAQRAEEMSAQFAGVRRVAGGGRPELGILGPNGPANPCRESGFLLRSRGNSGICRAYATQGCVDHFGFGVGFDGGHEVQIVADRLPCRRAPAPIRRRSG